MDVEIGIGICRGISICQLEDVSLCIYFPHLEFVSRYSKQNGGVDAKCEALESCIIKLINLGEVGF